MYTKVDTNLDFVEREQQILKFWREEQVFEKSMAQRQGCPVFTFYEGPPTANGVPHIGHIITRVVKDIIPRYRTMKGCYVRRKGGWDTHGLPVELEVEKALGINGKPGIEEYGVEAFIRKCKESVFKYEQLWRDMSERVGYWIDMDDPYVTYHNDYIESIWWALRQAWDKGLVYKGYKVVPYCPRCGTPLSSHEVSQGYEDVTEDSVYAKFKLHGKDNEYFLAWTTTPWTLPSNVALCVNGKESYVRVRSGGDVYILAKALAPALFGENCDIIEEMTGESLRGTTYEPLFSFADKIYAQSGKTPYRIVCDGYVTLTDGTGIVHTSPAFGEDDYRIAKEQDLPFAQLVNPEGKFTPEVTPWAGMFIKHADPEIIKALEDGGKLFKAHTVTHNYPFCWRCHTHLLYYARDTWFISMTTLRDKLVENNNTVNWMPDNIRTGRFGSFLENVVDWGISRERYWGTPLPIWECGCGHRHMVGSIAEMREMADVTVAPDIELHKPYIDEVTLTCPVCQGSMKRVSEVIDCWFDSGSMPFAQWHYPFENKDIFDGQFPADFISEAIDQTRGWFYSLMAISTLLFERPPYKNVVVLGHVLDKHGHKMSKHLGNVVDPWEVLNDQGADAVRWYFMFNSSPWLPSRFHKEAVNDAQRKFMGTMLNTYAFYVLYANIDKFNPAEHTLDRTQLGEMDRWVLSKLHSLIISVDDALASYKLTEPARAMNDFVDELSNWYVRRSRERFWASGMPQDKVNAYMTLYTVLSELVKLCAPFIPFLSEEIYGNIVRNTHKSAPISVHLCSFPVSDPDFIDRELEADMDTARQVVVLGRAARNEANIKNRQPIGRMYVKSAPIGEGYVRIIAEELNIKQVVFTDDMAKFTSYNFKPQLRTLGPKYGKLVPAIGAALSACAGAEFLARLRSGGATLVVDGNEVELSEADVLVEVAHAEGFMTQEDRGVCVAIDCVLTDELLEEGFVRELISKFQTMRKDAGFEVLDKISVCINAGEKLSAIFERNRGEIMREVLADEVSSAAPAHSKDWSINGEAATLGVTKL
ncbi:MAG: isoleucine--tRNA ligase [Defluviitaleaceae bacterium]|nr:isoleucine--tRNA ligase [Defluviitaleaceae bacterium]